MRGWMEGIVMTIGLFILSFTGFVFGRSSTEPIKCKVTVVGTAQYLHERMCDANEWKDCQPWVREELTIRERYLNLAKDVCR